jgi:hypothetical protein
MNKLDELKEAKKNVEWLLENNGLVDMKGIVYWAKRVEELREEIKGL